MKVLLNAWMQELDRLAIQGAGIPSLVLMENAALAATADFAVEFPLNRYPTCLVLSGKGHNGGDGLAIGRLLLERGYQVRFLLLAAPDQLSHDTKANFDLVQARHDDIQVVLSAVKLKKILTECNMDETFLVDAVFGTGLREPVKAGLFAEVFDAVNASGISVAAVDLPSGLSDRFAADAGSHIQARVTAALHSLKWAHLAHGGSSACGRIRVLNIGIPADLQNEEEHYIRLTEPADFKNLLARRKADAHKGDFGHALVVAGSEEKPGAGILAAYAALKTGAGLCTAAVSPRNRDLFVLAHPEIMTLLYEKCEEFSGRLNDYSCIVAGPGMGNRLSTLKTVSLLLRESHQPLILDADALNVLQGQTRLLPIRGARPLILTPHPGEFARLLDKTIKEIQQDRLTLAREFAMKYGLYLVLKGQYTLTATPAGRVWVNQTGNPGMATAGSGDVLSGIIAGLIVQFHPQQPMEIILAAAVFLHGFAGDLAARQCGEMGLTASDISAFIPKGILNINEFHSPFLGS
ncbi:MAG: NAD(P)H-hydrate dehydratase [Candidatus Aminicenantes bacterium]|nr:NAD(P)H-hydrate dehydratase [Candidatus Aminicenantes bacterium]